MRQMYKGFTIRVENGKWVALSYEVNYQLSDISLDKLKQRIDRYLKGR